MWKAGGIKIERTRAWNFFSADGQGNQWKTEFFYSSDSYLEILGWAIIGEKASIHRGTIAFGQKLAVGQFDPVLVARSWSTATKCDPLAKIWGVKKNKDGLHFQNESAASHRLWAYAESFWTQYFENCFRACSFWHRKYAFFSEMRVNFGRP